MGKKVHYGKYVIINYGGVVGHWENIACGLSYTDRATSNENKVTCNKCLRVLAEDKKHCNDCINTHYDCLDNSL